MTQMSPWWFKSSLKRPTSKMDSFQEKKSYTPKFNIAPEKWWLEDYIPFGKAYFQRLCWFQGGYHLDLYNFGGEKC